MSSQAENPEMSSQNGQSEDEYDVSEIPAVKLHIYTPNTTSPILVEAVASDSIPEIRAYLTELPQTCDLTCYHFEFNGQRIGDYVELSSIPGLVTTDDTTDDATTVPISRIDLVPDNYDEASARDHVSVFRDILVHPRLFNKATDFVDILNSETVALTDFARVMSEAKKRLLSMKPMGKNSKRKTKRSNNVSAKDLVVSSLIPAMTATEFYDPASPEVPACLNNITYSSWNPVPAHRSLQGDLFYLDVITLDGKALCITAARDGFFINSSVSASFNPAPSALPGHAKARSLSTLLSAAVPSFAEKWQSLLSRKHAMHPLEVQTTVLPAPAWTTVPRKHTADWNRADEVTSGFYGLDSRVPYREWNNEADAIRVLPCEQPKERLDRDRMLYRLHLDFIEAAKRGATAVVDGLIMPINPADAARAHVFVYNNIFYSFAVDPQQQSDVDIGGDRTARKMTKNDLVAMQVVVAHDAEGLRCTPTAVIDYRGARVVAQAVIPGVLTMLTTPLSGTLDQGAHYASLQNLAASMQADQAKTAQQAEKAKFQSVARALHVKPRSLKGTQDEEAHEAVLPGGVKALVGSDKLTYLLDLMNALPRDANYPAITDSGCVVRPEAVREFCRARGLAAAMPLLKQEAALKEGLRAKLLVQARAKQEKRLAKLAARKEKAEAKKAKLAEDPAAAAEEPEEPEEPEEEDDNEDPLASVETDEERTERLHVRKQAEALYTEAFAAVHFNPDLFTVAEAHLDMPAEELAADRALLQELADFIRGDLLQSFLQAHAAVDKAPVDGAALTKSMHAHGLNLRYMGLIASEAAKSDKPGHSVLHRVAVAEMVARAAKAALNEMLRDHRAGILSEVPHYAALVAAFLSALTGSKAIGAGLSAEELAAAETVVRAYMAAAELRHAKRPALNEELALVPVPKPVSVEAPLVDGAAVSTDRLSPANVWAAVRILVKDKFAFDLPAAMDLSTHDRTLLLRAVCLQTGTQLLTKAWDFTLDAPLATTDVVAMTPVVTAIELDSRDAREMLRVSKILIQNSALEAAYSYLHEAAGLYAQTLGALAAPLPEAYYLLSGIAVAVEELPVALDVLYRALVITQKLHGLDHPAVAALHSQVALMLVLMQRPMAAIRHLRRALYIADHIAGPTSALSVALHFNIALALFSAGKDDAALTHIDEAIAQSTAAHGETVALLPLVECKALMLYYLDQFSLAADAMKINVRIISASVPEEEHDQNKVLFKARSLSMRFSQLAQAKTIAPESLTAAAKEILANVATESAEVRRDGSIARNFWSELPLDVSLTSHTIDHAADHDSEAAGVPYSIGAMSRVFTKKQQ